MMNRPKPSETEEDILQMQQKFFSEKAKNPKIQPAAQIVKIKKQPKKSLFAQLRQEKLSSVDTKGSEIKKIICDEIRNKIVGDQSEEDKAIDDVVMRDIIEYEVKLPKMYVPFEVKEAAAFPKIKKLSLNANPSEDSKSKSLFAQAMERELKNQNELMESDEGDVVQRSSCLKDFYGEKSVMVEDTKTAEAVHRENLTILSQLKDEEILAEQKKLLESVDPTLVALLANKRKEKYLQMEKNRSSNTPINMETSCSRDAYKNNLESLEPSNAAVDLIERSSSEKWIHFDVVEKHKLEWMRDIQMQNNKLEPGEKFEARFDWKGVLLPYSLTSNEINTKPIEIDDRELYLHGDEPHRPGYTLQELFRLARSSVLQQRVSAFNAIAGILNIYQQGFYDQVLDLPITKIFFLLRFGFDDNSPSMLEVVGKALAYLFYNETDETLLDLTLENSGCHWQPRLEVSNASIETDDPDSIDNLQKHLQQLQVTLKGAAIKANIEETEEESKTSMSDFQLAEKDLVDCLLRTDILQRIYFILNFMKPNNSTVSSALKILIRLARSGQETALQIANKDDLMKCLFDNFLPGLQNVDTSLETPPYYQYPHYLCLKLMRILIASNLGIAVKLINFKIVDVVENYLFNKEDIKGKLIKVQIESLRVLRFLFLLQVENNTLYRKFLSAFRYMLDWHYNHVIYEEGGPFLIRQHAAALLATISSINGPVGSEVTALLGDILHDCCCNWFYKAMRNGVKEFSQATLLSACLDCVTWYIRRTTDAARFHQFINKYLEEFIQSESFVKFLLTISPSSIVLRDSVDRRTVHNPLPNVGSVIMNSYGPQLVVAQTYPVYLTTSLWRLMEVLLSKNDKHLFNIMLKPAILEPLADFLRSLSTRCNRYLATNFFGKMEMKLIFKLLCFEGFHTYFASCEMLQIVYNYLCCLTAEQIPEIEELFERFIFNSRYIQVQAETLNKWRQTCLELVYPHYIVVQPNELTLMMPFSQLPLLPSDWPYFQLKVILQNYVENVQHKSSLEFSEREILEMTLNFVTQLEKANDKLQIATPTEKLMYLMIAFMGPDSQFLDKQMHDLLLQHLTEFYAQSQNVAFQFDEIYQGKCRFENLYALFVDHFQAASYGDELFSSLVMIPLAQKYNNKWRRRVWSDYASALRFLNCSESLLIGGLNAYLEPPEEEESLIRDYNNALKGNLLREHTIPHMIASHHVAKFKAKRRCNPE